MHTIPKIFGVKFENPWCTGMRFKIFRVFLKELQLSVIGHLGMRFNNDLLIFRVRFTWILPPQLLTAKGKKYNLQ